MILKELLLLLKGCDIFIFIFTAPDDERKVLMDLGLLMQPLEMRKSGVHVKAILGCEQKSVEHWEGGGGEAGGICGKDRLDGYEVEEWEV